MLKLYLGSLALAVAEAKHLRSELLVSLLKLPDAPHVGKEGVSPVGALVICHSRHPGDRVKLTGGHHIARIRKILNVT